MFATSQSSFQTSGNSSPESEIRREVGPNGSLRISLPYRPTTGLKSWCWAGIGVGVFCCIFMLAWMSGPIWMGVRTMLEGAWLFGLCIACFGCLGCFGLRYSLMILVGSVAVMKGRTRSVVELYEGRATVSEEFFFLRWRRQCKFEKIERLELNVFEGKTPIPSGFRQINRALSAVSNDPEEKPFPVALAYGESDIQRLAEILREELHTQVVAREVLKPVSVERFRDEFKRVEILESLSADEEKVVRRPTDTEIDSSAMNMAFRSMFRLKGPRGRGWGWASFG